MPTGFPPSRGAAEAVATSALTLPMRFSKRWMIDRTIEELERFLVPAWQTKERPWLDGELIFVLDADCQTCLAGFVLTYSGADGLRVTSPGVSVDAGVTAGMGATASEDGFVRNEGSGGEQHQETSAVGTEPSAGGRSVTGRGSMVAETPVGECGPPSVDLVSMPWLPVQRTDGTVTEVSLLGLFELAAPLRRLVGDVPTQEMALLRMLLAIVYDTLDGPAEVEDWEDLWLSDDPFSAVPGYLERHRERFDLFHPERPFYQVADLRTAKGEVAPLSRIVADVPVGEPFFAMRRPGVDALSCAEAARWLVHAHAYDTSGIKSAMVDDERGRSGKAYPLGVGTLDNLRGVFAEGDTLQKTLLLSLIALEEAQAGADDTAGEDVPVWRRTAPPGPSERKGSPGKADPAGLRDLYTWQSRRTPGRGAPAAVLRSGIARWFTQVITASEIDPGMLVRLRLLGAVYGTQQSVIDEIVDDSVVLPVITLHEANPISGRVEHWFRARLTTVLGPPTLPPGRRVALPSQSDAGSVSHQHAESTR
nr:type I-E CRISPR-associated protein Cse1/CasA [Streptomyces sp. CB02959]